MNWSAHGGLVLAAAARPDVAGARTELHWLDAPTEECVRRIKERGGEGAEHLETIVPDFAPEGYVRPTADEDAGFPAHVPPRVEWRP